MTRVRFSKTYVLLLLFLFTFLETFSQERDLIKTKVPKSTPEKIVGPPKSKPATILINPKVRFESTASFAKMTVSADAHCLVYINNQLIADMSPGKDTLLSRMPGQYKIKAVSFKNMLDSFEDVLELRANEVLRYTIPLQKIIKKNKDAEEERSLALRRRNDSIAHRQKDSMAYLQRKDVVAINMLVKDLIAISGGSFRMGNNAGENDEAPEHTVSLDPFFLGKYEVTQQQWEDIMDQNPSYLRGCPQCPVENITWEDVQKFISKVSKVSGRKFRLPTEAEWEYVAQKGYDGKPDFKKMAWFADNALRPYPVDEKQMQPNKLGIYHIFGNVSEWCSDWYDKSYYKNSIDVNPPGPPTGKSKVIRGGSYADNAAIFRPSFRSNHKPSSKSRYIGVRLAMSQN